MRPVVIIAWTPPRVSSTSGSCGLILTAPSTCCAPVAALDGSDVTSGWRVAAQLWRFLLPDRRLRLHSARSRPWRTARRLRRAVGRAPIATASPVVVPVTLTCAGWW